MDYGKVKNLNQLVKHNFYIFFYIFEGEKNWAPCSVPAGIQKCHISLCCLHIWKKKKKNWLQIQVPKASRCRVGMKSSVQLKPTVFFGLIHKQKYIVKVYLEKMPYSPLKSPKLLFFWRNFLLFLKRLYAQYKNSRIYNNKK